MTFVTKHGNQISLGRIAMTIDELIKYRETILRNCEDLALELKNLSREADPLEHELRALQEDLSRLDRERLSLREQVAAAQHRFDDVYYRNEANVRAQCALHRRSLTRYSAKVLSQTLARAFKRQLQLHFTSVRDQQRNDYRQISSILAFRRLCYRFSDNRLQKYLGIWYSNALKPNQLKLVNRKVTKFMTKDSQKRLFLTRWHHQ